MADNRMVYTKFWNDNYIQSLKKDEKLLFLYLLTNPHTEICGLYEITLRTICNETGLSKNQAEEILQKFTNDGKAFYGDNLIFIPKYAFYQSASKLSHFQSHIEKIFHRYNSLTEIPFLLFCKHYKDLLKQQLTEGHEGALRLVANLMNNEQCTMNNEQRAKSGKKLFSESEYFDFEKFRERFNSNPDYQKYDAKYYYESALLWSKSNNEKKADWIATVYNWCRKDVSLNKPHLYKPETLKLK